MFHSFSGKLKGEVRRMPKKKKKQTTDNPRLDPEERIAPRFDSTGIALFPVAEPGKMGFRVLDDCTEEHIQ